MSIADMKTIYRNKRYSIEFFENNEFKDFKVTAMTHEEAIEKFFKKTGFILVTQEEIDARKYDIAALKTVTIRGMTNKMESEDYIQPEYERTINIVFRVQ